MRLFLLLSALLLLPPLAARAQTAAAPAGLSDADRLARFQTRMLRLEEEMRRLTGRVEELEHRLRQLEATPQAAAPLRPAPEAQTAAAPEQPGPAAETAGAPASPVAPLQAANETGGGSTSGAPAKAPPAPRPPEQGSRTAERPGTPAGPAATPTAPSPGTEAARPETPEAQYRDALALLEAGEFDRAEQAFQQFLDRYPDDPRAPSAAFWLGETYYYRQDYPTAAATFARNYRQYGPEARRAPDTLLKLGMSLAAMGEKERACQTFAELAKRYPRAPAAIRQALARERAAAGCS